MNSDYGGKNQSSNHAMLSNTRDQLSNRFLYLDG